MKKAISNYLIHLWEKGYLYILITFLYYFWWLSSGNVGVLDWFKEIAYFDYIRTSLKDYHMLPYYWWNIFDNIASRSPLPGSSSFTAIPETSFFSPLTPLLYKLNTFTYLKIYVFIQFLPGVIGILALRKKLQWNDVQFRHYAALFLFSPIALQHVAVGHFTWYNFYYFPWLIYFMAEKQTVKGIIGSAAVMGLIILQGGIYIVQYFGLFWIIYEAIQIIFWKDYRRILRVIFIPTLMVLLSWARVASTIAVYGDYIRTYFEINGYSITYFLFYALIPTVTIPPIDLWFHTNYLGWVNAPHDSGIFWGFSIIMLIFVALKYKNIVTDESSKTHKGLNYHAIFISASILFIVSFYKIWYFIMRGIDATNFLVIETIKHHGVRFIMGAYMGYAIFLANYSSSIWKEMDTFVRTKLWSTLKKILVIVGYCIFIGSGFLLGAMSVFRKYITDEFVEIITAAYNNTGHYWLQQRMEGIRENSLEFYFYRFDLVYSSIIHWIFIVFAIALPFFLITYLVSKNKNSLTRSTQRFPYLKYELLLTVPLAFSTAMWMNLMTSVPFFEYPIRKVLPPEVIVDSPYDVTLPVLTVTPEKLHINPKTELLVNGYVFPQLPANDYKLFDIITKNAEFFNKDGQLMLKPLDNEPIEMQFRKEGVKNALIITLFSWVVATGFMATVFIGNNRRRKNSIKIDGN